MNIKTSERGQALGILLLALLIGLFVLCGIGLLSGNSSVLDMYNWIGQLFQGLG